jgi:hypothetical protein
MAYRTFVNNKLGNVDICYVTTVWNLLPEKLRLPKNVRTKTSHLSELHVWLIQILYILFLDQIKRSFQRVEILIKCSYNEKVCKVCFSMVKKGNDFIKQVDRRQVTIWILDNDMPDFVK